MSHATVEPVFSPASALPELGALHDQALRRDWHATAATLNVIRSARGDDQYFVAADVVAQVEGVETLLDEVISQDPLDLRARGLRAHRRIVQGWSIRSSALTSHVTEHQVEEFHRFLREAETELIELCARTPQSGYLWSLRLKTARGLELGQSEAQRRYDRLARSHPDHLTGQHQLLQRLCPKWGGTWEEAFGFARECAANAAPGSAAPALVAIAHLERWITLDDKEQRRYLDDEVQLEVAQAADRSVGDPAFGANLHDVNLHSLFAILSALSGNFGRAREHFDALGATAHEGWFGYLGDPVREYHILRSATYGKRR